MSQVREIKYACIKFAFVFIHTTYFIPAYDIRNTSDTIHTMADLAYPDYSAYALVFHTYGSSLLIIIISAYLVYEESSGSLTQETNRIP